ncbi:MAG: DUF1648 domain-containing protein [Candidatus Fermentibacter sp.]|nr:DUF1648 domain-containing protein [Candidatus Fermentibacter sp.]
MKQPVSLLFVLLCVTCVFHALHYLPLLPERSATHFGISGAPDCWGGKSELVITYLGTVALMAAIFLAIPLAMHRLPDAMINLPGKAYWLAPERREETLEWLSTSMMLLGCATLVLMMDIFHQTFMVNLGETSGLPHPFLSMGVFFGVVVIWCAIILIRFRRVQPPPPGGESRSRSWR